jgi:GTP-binding protein EngB required for normal cell division
MTPLRMGRATVTGVSGEQLARKVGALLAAVDHGEGRLDPDHEAAARKVVDKVSQRTSLQGGHTVVALAGATGSGKSSLFNALVGAEVATVGARRPTTARPTAAAWRAEDATQLLDWLSVGQRHHVAPVTPSGSDGRVGSLDGLVLLDLPDFDSRVLAHREEAERILELVDVFVWVTDPQKYADARLHDDYLRALAQHDAVTVLVLNQADTLGPEEAEQICVDLARLAALDGLPGVQVVATSARTGEGVEGLRHRLAAAVAGKGAARARLAADVTAVAGRLRAGLADSEPQLAEEPDRDLVDALSRAAGIPTVVAAVERDYRREAWARTGWPFTRWLRAFRPDPLKRFRLESGRDGRPAPSEADVRSVLGRSSLPPPTPAARSAVDLATRRVGERAAAGLPARWADEVADAATPPRGDLTDVLDQAVISTPLRARDPMWWTLFGLLQQLLALTAVTGLAWLVVLAVLGWLQLPEIDTPRWGPLPLPLLMLVGGLLLGVLLAVLARALARVGARRRARLIGQRLREAVSRVARERVIAPVRAVLAEHAAVRDQLDRARS